MKTCSIQNFAVPLGHPPESFNIQVLLLFSGRTPYGGAGGVLFKGAFWAPSGHPLLRTPSENPSQNPFFYCKTHSRPTSENPSESPSPEPFPEPFLERCVAVRPLRRAPILESLKQTLGVWNRSFRNRVSSGTCLVYPGTFLPGFGTDKENPKHFRHKTPSQNALSVRKRTATKGE